jgi:hypothetical protein
MKISYRFRIEELQINKIIYILRHYLDNYADLVFLDIKFFFF